MVKYNCNCIIKCIIKCISNLYKRIIKLFERDGDGYYDKFDSNSDDELNILMKEYIDHPYKEESKVINFMKNSGYRKLKNISDDNESDNDNENDNENDNASENDTRTIELINDIKTSNINELIIDLDEIESESDNDNLELFYEPDNIIESTQTH